MQPKSFTYAGTKDKRGITVQQVTVYRVTQDRLLALNRSKMMRDMKIGNTRHVNERLTLGDLKGNLFSVAIR